MSHKLRAGRTKRPDAARNARSMKILLRHASDSRALRYADLDLRSTAGREYAATKATLTAHLGGEVTAPQAILVDHAARLHVLTRLAWDELSRSGAFRDGEPRPAYDAFRRAAADERSVLVTLGLERRAKDVPDLQDYLRSKASKRLRLGRTLDAEDAEE